MNPHCSLTIVTGAFLFAVLARPLPAATFNIADGDVAGLINAINTANSNNQNDIINLNTNGHYTLTVVNNTAAGPTGLPVIGSDNSHAVTINGNNATLQRSAVANTPQFRILQLDTDATVSISALNIAGGALGGTTYVGGGIYNYHGALTLTNCTLNNNSAPFGGAIYVYGFQGGAASLIMLNCTARDNKAGGVDQFSNPTPGVGGGIACNNDTGVLTVTNCAIYGNTSAAFSSGGGIYLDAGSATVQNTTIFGNDCGDGGEGGGIFTDDDATLTVRNSTISGNRGECIWAQGVSLILSNNILNAGDASSSLVCFSSFTSDGYNLSSDNADGRLTGAGDQINTDPLLDPSGLQDNGGPTKTIALMAGSPALDQGLSYGATTDQRGQTRPRDLPSIPNAAGGDGSDIGAFESIDPKQGGVTLTVNTNADHDDGICGAVDCTLREAIAVTNNGSGGFTIAFAASVTGTISLDSGLGQLLVTNPVTISGPGARVLAVSGNSALRVFSFTGGSSYILSGLTIRDGVATNVAPFQAAGGALSNYGILTVNDCAFINSRANGGNSSGSGGSGSQALGGGIYNFFGGALTLNRCTFSANSAAGGRGGDNTGSGNAGGSGGTANGGALYNDSGCTVTLSNCSFTSNSATGGAGGNNPAASGGNGGDANSGISNLGSLTMTACTVSANTGTGGAGGSGLSSGAPGASRGGLTSGGGTMTVANTIVAGNTGSTAPDVSGTITSSGYNLVGKRDGSSGFTSTGDQTGTIASPLNAQLGPLGNNGGSTDTMALLSGSPALDRGNSFGLTSDQRGSVRPVDDPGLANASGGDGSDIGAVEDEVAQTGATLVVNTRADHTDGTCGLGDCTLREAITAANSIAGNNTITFAPALTGTISLGSVLPNLSTNIGIQGPGANVLTVQRVAGIFRIFKVSNGTTSGPTVSISGLTIQNGSANSDYGGGVYNDHGSLTLSGCTVRQNTADNGGGGVMNDAGILTMQNCTVNNDTAAFGGGIYNRSIVSGSVATATVTNCTLVLNTANGGSSGYGGGILNAAASSGTASLTVHNCTFSANRSSSPSLGGAVHNRFGTGATATATLASSIFKTGPLGPNLVNEAGTITSQGYNLSDDAAGGDGSATPGGLLNATGDTRNTNPLLSALGNFGGPTQTQVPLLGSAAVDRGKSFGLTTDQRGAPRPVDTFYGNASGGDGSDIGAVEMNLLGGPDSDSDGMSDDFELFFGVTDPNADADGDGLTNLQEFQMGTNPLDAASNLRIIGVAKSGSDFVVIFKLAVVGKTYRLERKDLLTDPTWTSINGVSDLSVSAPGQAQITDTNGAAVTRHFYRIRVLP